MPFGIEVTYEIHCFNNNIFQDTVYEGISNLQNAKKYQEELKKEYPDDSFLIFRVTGEYV